MTVTKSRTIEVGAQLTVGVSAEWAVAKVNAELGISTKVSWTSSVGLKTNTNSPAHELTTPTTASSPNASSCSATRVVGGPLCPNVVAR
ncbi:hypothetical protein [Streptomyces sp. NPDC048266]|uniref:hypothetical protein n=1 Tax=Streptomyces sp. NPDC048266 TaxID=3155787 RepID=UPI0033C8140D